MEDQNVGGSYIRQKDGSLKLVDRTEEAKPEVTDIASTDAPADVETPASQTPADTTAAAKKKG
ncbi:hypothetical protein [Rhizobium sp. Leaf341]|uniref:hypothetical protein n=1 Tax=Rhizobium sp. Leaf341 TaxID=1736344 RepID=UPI000712FB17|nr:hypothetical protein [Rhizobium sp. Leaf341]KQR75749.1 hypothetical protein ASG03_18940 [Rhizobium sp. Leaf341]